MSSLEHLGTWFENHRVKIITTTITKLNVGTLMIAKNH